MFKEFKEFAMRGNVIDMAVGIIIGAAFGRVVTSLVNDVIMPPIGLLLGKVDFSSLSLALSPTVAIKYGMFINSLIDFVIVAFAIFIVIKQVNRLTRSKKPEPVTTKECSYCCSTISVKASRCPNCTSALEI